MKTAARVFRTTRLRTLSARLITRHGVGPRNLQIRAWAWLAAETDDLARKQQRLQAIVAPAPEPDWARHGLQTTG